MCRVEDGDPCELWEESHPVARKDHKCTECGRAIPKSERYLRIKSLYKGMWNMMKVCTHCAVGADWLREECGGFCQDGIREEIYEHAEEYKTPSLWRLVVGANRKWQRFDGAGLMAIPKLPPVSRHI